MKYWNKIIVFGMFLFSPMAFAQNESSEAGPEEVIQIIPRIVAEEAVEVGKKVIFDASSSEYNPAEPAEFIWDLGDGNTSRESAEIVHTYQQTGEFTVQLMIRQAEQEILTRETIFVFDTQAVLITTQSIEKKNAQIASQAKENGVFLKTVTVEEETSSLILEEQLLQNIQEQRESIASANIIFFWTPSSVGVQAFTRFWQNLESDEKIAFENKLLARITENSMSVSAATLQQSYEILQPGFFLLTRPEALNPIFQQKENAQILTTLQERGIEFQIINEESGPSIFLLLTRVITSFLAQGLPASTILLLLTFPFIAFLVAFSRQVIGLSTYGVFLPIMLTLAFQILTLPFSILILVVIVVLSFFLRNLFAKLDILYVPRAAMMLSAIALSFLSVIWFALRFGSPVSITLAIFPMLVMSTISEKFLSAQSEEGFVGALLGALETIGIAIVAFFLVNTAAFKELLLSLPELIVFPLLGIFLLGKFTGLRLSEYFRFRSLLHEGMEE